MVESLDTHRPVHGLAQLLVALAVLALAPLLARSHVAGITLLEALRDGALRPYISIAGILLGLPLVILVRLCEPLHAAKGVWWEHLTFVSGALLVLAVYVYGLVGVERDVAAGRYSGASIGTLLTAGLAALPLFACWFTVRAILRRTSA